VCGSWDMSLASVIIQGLGVTAKQSFH